jgi:hypothetical protein
MHCQLPLFDSVLDPVESHVHSFRVFDFGAFVGKAISCGVVGGGEPGGAWLGIFKFFEDLADVGHFLAIVWKRAPVSASDADAITFFMMWLSM